jgi:adenylylsulfate kinase
VSDSPSGKAATNVKWHGGHVNAQERAAAFGHGGAVVWMTGLSGSGKSTVARLVEAELLRRRVFAVVLDGDNLRHGLNRDLGFSAAEREENIRRSGEVAVLFAEAGAVVLAAFVSPFRRDRDQIRARLPQGQFLEVYVRAPLEVCETRDPKGLYKKARAGEIQDFTGISQAYEEPASPELVLDTSSVTAEESAAAVVRLLEGAGVLER